MGFPAFKKAREPPPIPINAPPMLINKRLESAFPEINIKWLITGKGNMLDKKHEQVLQNEYQTIMSLEEEMPQTNNENASSYEKKNIYTHVEKNIPVEKIILIFQDNTFEVLQPKKEINGNL
jgi:hypothetical protein